MQGKGVRITLRVKLMASLLLLSIVPIAMIAYTTFFSSSHFFKQSMVHSLEGIARLKSESIENFIKDRVDQIEKTASSSDLVDNLEKVLSEKSPGQQPAADIKPKNKESGVEGIFEEVKLPADIKENKEKIEKSPEYQALNKALGNVLGDGAKYEDFFILDTSGIVAVSTVYENEGKSAQNEAFFANSVKTTFIRDPFISEITKKLTMIISTPVKNKNGKVIGVLGARLNLDKFYQTLKDEAGLGNTGETIIGKKIGDEIIFMGPTRYDDDAALKRKIKVQPGRMYSLQEAARGQEGSGFYQDYRGVDTLAVWKHIPVLNWGLVVKVDAKDALQPIFNTRNTIFAIAVVLVLLVIFLSSYISKGVVGPIRELTRAADDISKGDTDIKIQIKSNDEVGDLAESFERMLAAIKFFKDKDKEDKQ